MEDVKTYSCEIKKPEWREPITLSDIIGDGIMDVTKKHRWFVFKDLTRMEVPIDGVFFKFSPEREKSLMDNARKQQMNEGTPK